MSRLRSLGVIAAGTLMIMAVVLINGHPSVFTDTDDYFIEGRTFAFTVAYALHLKAPDPPPTDAEDIADAQQAAADLHMSHTEVGARSPYYGALLYVSQRIGTLWLTTLIQAVIGAWLMFLFWKTSTPGAPLWTAFAAEAAVAVGSTLPFFASFAMPDVFSGYAAMAATLLLVFWDRLTRFDRVCVAVLLGVAMTFHTSHLLNTVAMLILGAAMMRRVKAPGVTMAAAIITVLVAVMGAMTANGLYKEGVKLKTGDELRRPPFLAMRVLADGPGREYLRYSCDHGVAWALCRFRNLPLVNSQDMLWSDDRKKGIFNVTTYDVRLKMEQEENSFVLHAVAFDPIDQAVASLVNWGEQLSLVYLDDPLKNPHYYLTNEYWSTTNLPWLIEHTANCGRDHWECGPRLSIEGSRWLHSGLLALSFGVILWRLCQPDLRRKIADRDFDWRDDRTRLLMALAMLVAAVLINGFVCGALSGPFARYQARITWLVTAGATASAVSMTPEFANSRLRAWLLRLWEDPRAQAARRRIDFAFIRFGMVGATGFVVDASVLHLMIRFAGMNYFTGRLVSFSVAVLTTWLLNRTFTFKAPSVHGPLRQAIVYAAVQGAGGAANIAVYTAAIALAPALKHELLIPLALGSAAGLCLTFAGSKHLAFRPAAVAEARP